MNKFFENLGLIVIIILTAIVFSIIFALPVKWCWNYIMPYLFNLKEITIVQAWVMSVLCTFLFRSVNVK